MRALLRTVPAASVLAVAVALAAASPAAALTAYTVTSSGDEDDGPGGCATGTCSLREAIADANADGDASTIGFDAARVVSVASALPGVTAPVAIDGSGSTVSGASLMIGAGAGVVTVSRLGFVPPFAIVTSAPGAPAAPAGVKVRRAADGSVRLTGTTAAGSSLEVFSSGIFQSTLGPVGGAFDLPLSGIGEGARIVVTATTSGGTSSTSAPLDVSDLTAPRFANSAATSAGTVRVRFSEPVAAASVAAADLRLTMGGVAVPISSLALAADRRTATLASTARWAPGTAGRLTLAGAIADVPGNAMATPSSVKVWASPGDTVPPRLGGVKLSGRTLCFKRVSHRCTKQGAALAYTLDGKATVTLSVARRAGHPIASSDRAGVAGANTTRIGSRIDGLKLRPRRYILTVLATDAAGNRSAAVDLPFRVRH